MDWQDIKQWRRARREELLARRLEAGRAARLAWSQAIEATLRALLRERSPQRIGFYMPFKGEFDARPLVRFLIEDGWTAALPVVIDKKGPLEFRDWRPGVEMEPGVYDIPIPKARNVVTPDLLLVPVVGFDRDNYRLGYGGGYYDRTLGAIAPRPATVGIGFDLLRLDSIYPQPHDIPLDVIVTETAVHRR